MNATAAATVLAKRKGQKIPAGSECWCACVCVWLTKPTAFSM